jgi:hypothetical protein
MNVRTFALIALSFAVSACGEAAPQKQRPQTIAPPPVRIATGLDRVMGKDARSLVTLFGPAAKDVREASARKLQFSSTTCILDAYLYPPSKGKEPVVTFLSARIPDGRDADKASCVSALSQRK